MTVLVIAQEGDAHTRAVVREIQSLGSEAVVADLSEFPQQGRLSISYTCLFCTLNKPGHTSSPSSATTLPRKPTGCSQPTRWPKRSLGSGTP